MEENKSLLYCFKNYKPIRLTLFVKSLTVFQKFERKSTLTTNEARVDVTARSVWIKGQMAYSDVNIFNALAKCYQNLSLQAAHKNNENEKKKKKVQRSNH